MQMYFIIPKNTARAFYIERVSHEIVNHGSV